ncbi:uncharacterized protein LOC100906236 [Galendromus occidentalis]|uniref:Uncharacterized protein LOC100906236 n=1 Tax=Galendromus occidentalis TaxID=34638 RepID=A0AAJ6QYV5_9ACAR|nr:uncharacterized protein LOC100906236 [Galendromus occidentalis]
MISVKLFGREGKLSREMRLMKWMQEGALETSEIPYRHDRLGLPRRMSWTLGFTLAVLAFICLLSGAILTAIVFTEVRPPTADENYNRYLGSDYRRIIGPILMIMSLVLIVTGLICVVFRRISHLRDKEYMAIYQQQVYSQRQPDYSSRGPQRPQQRQPDQRSDSMESVSTR